jgi:IS30 family transposase
MPYTHFTKDERIALQAMVAMRLPLWCIAVILGKHLSSLYRELARNSYPGLYTGEAAHSRAGQQRLESKGRPKTGNPSLTATVKNRFKKDFSPDQIAGRLREEYPEQEEIL